MGHSPTALPTADVVGALDRLTDGILVLDRDRRVRYCNEAAETLLWRSRAQLLGAHMWTALPDAVGDAFRLADDEAATTGLAQRLVEHFAPTDRWLEGRMFTQDAGLVLVLRDVTDELRAQGELRARVDRVSEAERIVRFGIWEWEVAGNRVRWSDELHRIYGLQPGEFKGTVDAFIERVHPDDRERVWANIARSLETLQPFVFEERIILPNGAERVLLSQGRVIVGSDGSPCALVGVCHDVTDRARAEQALGASERRMRAIMDNTPSLITVKDLDGRYVMSNAESGRVIGVAPARLVGMSCADVFAEPIAVAQRANDRLAAAEGEPVYDETVLALDGDERSYVTVTFALFDDNRMPVETCTIATDVTERRERESARRERLECTERMTSALEEGRMLLVAQPIVDLASGRHVARELLVRMRCSGDSHSLIEPHAFLPAAERYGLIQLIDVWVVRQALRLADETVSHVNLSGLTLCDLSATDEITDALIHAPQAARRIVFEVTETASVEQLHAAREFADRVTSLGCGLALDDFGVGFGSLTYLRSLPLSCIKIDRSFVHGITASPDDRRVVQAIIGIARDFAVQTIAEGVEDEPTQQLLRTLGADYVQGYHLGRPSPIVHGAHLR